MFVPGCQEPGGPQGPFRPMPADELEWRQAKTNEELEGQPWASGLRRCCPIGKNPPKSKSADCFLVEGVYPRRQSFLGQAVLGGLPDSQFVSSGATQISSARFGPGGPGGPSGPGILGQTGTFPFIMYFLFFPDLPEAWLVVAPLLSPTFSA